MNALTRTAASVAAALALTPAFADAADPAPARVGPTFLGHVVPAERPDLIETPGSIRLVTQRDGRIFFDVNPVVGDAPARPAATPRDPLAPESGIWFTTRHDGETRFDVNPAIGAGEDTLAGHDVDPGLVAAR